MKGTKTILKIFILFSFVLLQGCSVPFANGVTGKDIIKLANASKNIKNITKEGATEENHIKERRIIKQ